MPTSTAAKTRRGFRRKITGRPSLVDESIKVKHAEYRKALEIKAEEYGYIDPELGVLVLEEGYFLSKPEGWVESLMGEWVYPVVKEVMDEEDMYSDKPPKNIPLHRSERNYQIEHFKKHYEDSFKALFQAREKLKDLDTADVDIHNAVATIQSVSQAKRGYHQLGKSEVMKSVLGFMGPNSIDYKFMVPSPPKSRKTRTKSI